MIKYVGIFLVCFGFALKAERKQRAKGKETWESKHNINVPKWLSTLLIIIGIICVFGSNFRMHVSTDVATGQNVDAEQSMMTEQNTVEQSSTQGNTYELDGGKSGRTFYVGTDIPAGTYEIQAGKNSAYVTVYGGEAENYEVIAHISTNADDVQDGELTVGDTVTLPNDGDISMNGDASIIFVAK